ncbi:protein eyes shut homolog [Candoia aspera]|uniref:protein eyes shut homolog n=1 Tax=Candoia aspera TaxID=51853 RepID=UPI002FD7C282
MVGSDLESESSDKEVQPAPEVAIDNVQTAQGSSDELPPEQAEEVGLASNQQKQLLSVSEDEGTELLPSPNLLLEEQMAAVARRSFVQEPDNQSGLCDLASETMKLKLFVVTVSLLLQSCMVDGQTPCNRFLVSEWKTQPTVHIVNWSLSQNICSSFYTDCWNIDSYQESSTADNGALRLSQICPLQLQLGDMLFVSSEPSFQSHGMNLANVSLEEFIRCPQPTDFPQHQLIFDDRSSGMHQLDPKWLGIGTHYFAEVPVQGPLLCHFGLRLNVTVKPHICQGFSNSPFCSGQGKCLSHIWDEAYNCHCSQPYSGQFCQEIDQCSGNPCYNRGICISRKNQKEDDEDSYECICPPSFAGKNCSEIIGQCQQHSCGNGSCSNVSPNTFRCRCDKDSAGKKCIYCTQ